MVALWKKSRSSNNLGTWCKELTHSKRPWFGKDWKQEEKETTGWDDCWHHRHGMHMAWVWANPRSWWRTGKPGMLQTMALQRVRHDWATEPYQHCHTFYLSTVVRFPVFYLANLTWLISLMLVFGPKWKDFLKIVIFEFENWKLIDHP